MYELRQIKTMQRSDHARLSVAAMREETEGSETCLSGRFKRLSSSRPSEDASG